MFWRLTALSIKQHANNLFTGTVLLQIDQPSLAHLLLNWIIVASAAEVKSIGKVPPVNDPVRNQMADQQ